MTEAFSQNFDVYRLLSHPTKLCTLQELRDVYNIDEFYDMLEIIELDDGLKEYVNEQQSNKK